MTSSEPQSDTERTALNVFHDLQLAHVRRERNSDPSSPAMASGQTSTDADRRTAVVSSKQEVA